MNIKTIFFTSAIIASIFSGCSEIISPAFENPMDPEASNFKGNLPSDFTIDSDSPQKLTLKWKDNSGYEKKYTVERLKSYGNFEVKVELPPNSAEYIDTSVSIIEFYGYRIKMISSNENNSCSDTVWAIYSPYNNFIRYKNRGIVKYQFSNDEKYKALSTGVGDIYIVRSSDNDELKQLSIASLAFAFTPDNKYLAVADDIKQYIGIWDISSKTIVRTVTGFNTGFRSLSFSPDGEFLAVTDRNDLIKILNFKTGEEVFSLKADNSVNETSFSLTSKYFIYSTNTTLYLMDTNGWKVKKTFVYAYLNHNQHIEFSANDKYMLFEDGNNISVYDVYKTAIINKIEGAVSFSIQKNGEIMAYSDKYGSLQIWQIENCKQKFQLKQIGSTGNKRESFHVWENGNVDYIEDSSNLITLKYNNSWVRHQQ